uniref:G-protein coupled receptors family 2 profile 2 domain-containing protein n=1 Tax=Scleropages formosus TaxID=113540 RepID=A0A8C9SN79_SCLFO
MFLLISLWNGSLARATLVLIPLLGIHEVVFTFFIDEYMEDKTRYVKNFINLTLSSFQGLLVAILYCFANGEVQAELKKRWQLFLFANHLDSRRCTQGTRFKHVWKCSRRRPAYCSDPCKCTEDGSRYPGMRQQRLSIHSGKEVQRGWPSRLEFYARGSLSSSEGETTHGETMEEILEESEF